MYDDLLKQTESFLVELHSRQEQQKVEEEEAAHMKKLREEQASINFYLYRNDLYTLILICEEEELHWFTLLLHFLFFPLFLTGAGETSPRRRSSQTEEDSGGDAERKAEKG